MLLVKSKELRNSGKILIKTGGYILPPVLFSPYTLAQSDSSPMSATTIVSTFLSLLLVVAIIFALAYVMRRFNVTPSGGGHIKVVASMAAGARERVMVIDVGGEQHLIGITSQNINHLSKLENPIVAPTPSTSGGAQFKQKLVQAMAGKINPSVKDNDK